MIETTSARVALVPGIMHTIGARVT